MTPQLEKRRRVMQRSIALGHCICDVKQPCPCPTFKAHGVCLCAGERLPVETGDVRLTQHVRNAGCASKISKSLLQEVLGGLPQFNDPRVLVGAAAGDDAGVIMLSPDTATILTVDVFAPSVDDPFTFGQIAAANSLSDIYAMGGVPQAALSIIGFPMHLLPAKAMHDILRGGIEKMREAGTAVVGGHSINDAEVKCGFAVLGTSRAGAFLRNAGGRVGDAVVLTKPLGTGIVVFAHQLGLAPAGAIDQAAKSMCLLNRNAADLMLKHEAHAVTDVTGFSLLGHLAEIVRNSDVEVQLDFDRIPLLPGTLELSQRDVLPGGIERNRESVDEALLELSQLGDAQREVLFCPETSGGLVVLLPEQRAERYVRELCSIEASSAAIIGRVTRKHRGGRIAVMTSKPVKTKTRVVAKPQPAAQEHSLSCCSEQPPPEGALPAAAASSELKTYLSAVGGEGAISQKHKKLIALALSVTSKCEPCVKINVQAAKQAGATDAEISEAVSLGIAFGGAPAAMFYNTIRSQK